MARLIDWKRILERMQTKYAGGYRIYRQPTGWFDVDGSPKQAGWYIVWEGKERINGVEQPQPPQTSKGPWRYRDDAWQAAMAKMYPPGMR